ncbi:MAG: acyl-CoA dehydrogenase family protein [Pseudomonadota bacterium]
MNAQEFLNTAKTFRDEHIRPNAADWEQQRRQPVQALRDAAARGLFRLEAPASAGGYGLGFTTKIQFCEDLSRADMPFIFSLINTQNIAARLADNPTLSALYVEELLQGKLFGATALSEPGVGSDFAAISTSAEKVEGGWALTGEKAWITNAEIADLFVVYAQTDKSIGRHGITSFLVDARKAGFTRAEPFQLIGGHSIGAGGFKLDKYYVPDDHVLSSPGVGFKDALSGINGARVYVAAMCVGLVADALDQAVAYANKREAFGTSLMSHQGLRWKLADVSTELAAMRTLTTTAGEMIENEQDAVMIAAQAKKFATERAMTLIETCMQCMGANGLREEHGLGRHLAAAKIAAYTDGSIEMMNERIGAGLK